MSDNTNPSHTPAATPPNPTPPLGSSSTPLIAAVTVAIVIVAIIGWLVSPISPFAGGKGQPTPVAQNFTPTAGPASPTSIGEGNPTVTPQPQVSPTPLAGAATFTPVVGQNINGPHVVGITAGVGMRAGDIAGIAPIAVSFSEAMNQQSAQAAFSLSPAVTGDYQWQQNTMIFTPKAPLAASAVYTVSVATSAQTSAGKPLAAPDMANFNTAPPPAILRVLPSDGASEVPTDTIVTVSFNRPMIPLTALDNQPDPSQWVTISPTVAGRWVWLGTAAVGFHAAAPGFLPASDYTVAVKAGWPDDAGVTMAQGSNVRFTTIKPAIMSVSPYNGSSAVPIDSSVSVSFNLPMDKASVQGAFRMHGDSGDVAGAFGWSDDGMTMAFTPTKLLDFSKDYQLSFAAPVKATVGNAVTLGGAENTWLFSTTSATHVVSYSPGNIESPADKAQPANSFSVGFNNPLAPNQDWGQYLSVSPVPQGYNGHLSVDSGGTLIFTDNVTLAANTSYKFDLKAGLKDKWGFAVQPYSWSVNIGPLPPSLTIPDGFYHPEFADNPTRIHVQTANLSKITMHLYQLSADDLRKTLAQPNQYNPQGTPTPPGQLKAEWDLPVQAGADGAADLYPSAVPPSFNTDRLSPGFYYLRVTAVDPYNNGAPIEGVELLAVGHVGLVAKREGSDVLVWVADMGSGKPVANYPLRVEQVGGDNNQALTTQRSSSGGDGVMRLKLDNASNANALYIWSEQQNDAAFMSANWSQNIQPYDLNASQGYDTGAQKAAIFTDRPIYRTAQTVYYRLVYRNDDDANYTLPAAGTTLMVQASTYTNQGEQAIYTGTVQLAANGEGDARFSIPPTAPVGDYTLSIMPQSGNTYSSVASASFSVQEYRKPDFQVNVTTGGSAVHGDPVTATVQTSYYFGGPLTNVTATINVQASPYYFYWADPNTGETYTFGEGSSGIYDYEFEGAYPYSTPEPVQTFKARTDKDGNLTVDASKYVTTTDSSKSLQIEAEVQDLSNQAVANSSTTVVHQGLYYVGLKVGDYVATAKQPTTITVRTVTYDGKIQPNTPVKLTFVRHDWVAPPYGTNQQWQQSDVPVGSANVTTDGNGRAIYMFAPPGGGSYSVIGESDDSRGNHIHSRLNFWASSDEPGFVPWRYQNDAQVTMVADKTKYHVGDTAHILVTSPYTNANALLTVERGHIKRYQVITLKGGAPTIDVPLVDGDLPNVYVSLVLLGNEPSTDKNAPADWERQVHLRAGYVDLSLDTSVKQMRINLAPQGQQPYAPGEPMTLSVHTEDMGGLPLQSQVSLAVVDEAIYAIGGENAPDLFGTFWAERGTSVSTASSFSSGQAPQPQRYELGATAGAVPAPSDNTAAPAGDAVAQSKSAAPTAPKKVRSDFRDTAFWTAAVSTDANGNATITVPLPDNLTTWRLTTEGVTTDNHAGEATTDITATQPLLLRPVQPRFLITGDNPHPQAIIQNNTDGPLTVQASLDVSGALTLDPSAASVQTLTVARGDQAVVTWSAKVGEGSVANLRYWVHTMDANAPDYREDAVAAQLPVEPFAAPEAVATSGEVSATRADESVFLPYSISPELGELVVQVSPSLAAATTSSINYVTQYPYESTDQTVSRFLPLVVLEQTYNQQGLKTQFHDQIPGIVASAMQRLSDLQQPDGGWAWWLEGPSNWWETAYVVQGLVAARDAGYNVPSDMLQRGIQRLQGFQQDESQATLDETYHLNMRAYSLYVLGLALGANSDNASAMQQEAQSLTSQTARLSTHARAWLALAMNQMGMQQQAKSVMDSLIASARQSSTTAHWEEGSPDYWSMGTDNRATALAIDAMVSLAPNDPILPKAVRWMMSAEREGHWLSSQETAITLISLAHYMAESKELSADYSWQVNLLDKPLGQGVANSTNLTQTVTLTMPVSEIPQNNNADLAFGRNAANGKLYYNVSLRYYVPGQGIKSRSEGLAISRSYYLMANGATGDEGLPIKEVNAGDLVKVRLTIVVPETSYYVMVTDPLPAGLEGVNGSLNTTSFTERPQNPSGFRTDEADSPWWRWGPFDDTEMLDDRTALFATYMSPGTYVYEYFARATTPGVYMGLPAHIELSSQPDVFGSSDGGTFTVK